MKTKTTPDLPSPPTANGDRRKSLDELIAEQGVAQTATVEHLLGAGTDLWEDDEDFDRFLQWLQATRKEKG